METEPLAPPVHDVIVYDVQLSHPEDGDNAPPYFHDSPLQLLLHDIGVLLRNSRDIINIFRPFPRIGDKQKDISYVGLLGQVVFVAISLLVTALLFSAFAVGFPAPIIAVGVWVATLIGMSALQGRVKPPQPAREDKFKDEAWLFVNGIATSASGLQLILDYLHKKFGRNVIGIHNRTFGIWWDLVECMLQRDFLWPTLDVRVGYQTIVSKIKDKDITKVVLLAHSQGGIIMSTWIDQLLADFAAEELAKVEIYTFAAAANHFSVPYTVAKGQKRFVFGAVEHFANTRDYVAQIGVLAFAPTPPDGTIAGQLPSVAAEGRFAGRIFKRVGTTGHMLLSHYFRNGSSILDHPTVQKYSQLAKYLDNRSLDTVQRVAHADTVKTDTPGQSLLAPST